MLKNWSEKCKYRVKVQGDENFTPGPATKEVNINKLLNLWTPVASSGK